MTLMIFEDSKGLWMPEEGEERTLPFDRSSADISVTDGSGCILEGTLRVNGTPFPVVKGKCKLLTEAFHGCGLSEIVFVSGSGIKRDCSYVRNIGELAWYFPSPREALESGEIVSILMKLERLREKLESAKSLCSDAVSGVLGI